MTLARPLLVLDLDETLIHATRKDLGRAADFEVGGYNVFCRPWLSEFIAACFADYEVAVWSSASDPYVRDVVRAVFPDPKRLVFVWGRSKVAQIRSLPHHWERYGMGIGDFHTQKRLKKLKRFGWSLDQILIIDDSPEKSAQNYGNVIHPKPYFGEVEDGELPKLAAYLEMLSTRRDFRRIEKRRWHEHVPG